MWGRDIGAGDLKGLVARLGRIDGLKRVRLMYLHPQGVTDELIDTMLDSGVVVPYFDLSLQHVAPSVLKGMGRWGGRVRFEKMIARIRGGDPLAGVRSTFIMGFPGESDVDAREVQAFVEDSELDWIGVFTYSREEGTKSHDMGAQVDPSAARERSEMVAGAAEIAMARRASSLVGNRFEVLAERYDRDEGTWIGRSQREAPEVDGEIGFVSRDPVSVGDYVEVEITGSNGADLTGAVTLPV